MRHIRPAVLAALALMLGALAALPTPARAGKGDKDANVTIEGDVVLPPAGVKEPSAQYVGFIERIANPITALRPYDPRPECFVFLEGGPAGDDAAKPELGKTLEWQLSSQTFMPLVKPFMVNQPIQIRNVGKNTHPLTSDMEGVIASTEAVGPGGVRPLTIKTTGKAIIIRSQDSPHLEGRVVALPTKYFAMIKRDGSFKIDNVPAGTWTLRVWYKDGWLAGADQKIEVGPKMGRVKVSLPERLDGPAKSDTRAPDKGGK